MACAFAQDPSEPPPPPPLRGDAASLKDTMKFLQDKISGKVDFMVYKHDNIANTDATFKTSNEISNVTANVDVDQCHIYGHSKRVINGEVKNDQDFSDDLKQVRDVVVILYDQVISRGYAKKGQPEVTFKTDPLIFDVQASGENGGNFGWLFYEESLANRVAAALQHGVDLCGGGNKEPF